MNDIDLTQYLPVLSVGLWVGIFITFICKMFSYAISVVIGWFKRLI